jgi:hypothetical protein
MATPLIDFMGQDLTGLNNPPSATLSVWENLEILVAATGSGRAAARALGVAESTLRGWRKGARPRRTNLEFVATARGAATAYYRPSAFGGSHYDAAYRGDVIMAIRGWIKVSNDSRKRTIHVGREIPQRSMQGILRAWSAGNDEKAESLLVNAITRYYANVNITAVLGVWFE